MRQTDFTPLRLTCNHQRFVFPLFGRLALNPINLYVFNRTGVVRSILPYGPIVYVIFMLFFFSHRSRAAVIDHVGYWFGGLYRTRKRNRDDHVIRTSKYKVTFFSTQSFFAKKSLTTYFRFPYFIATIFSV